MPQRNSPIQPSKSFGNSERLLTAENRAKREAEAVQYTADRLAFREHLKREYRDALHHEALENEKNSNTDNSKTQNELERQKKIALMETAPHVYNDNPDAIPADFRVGFGGGSRRNKATPKSKAKPTHEDMTMKDIKELCKANLINLSKVVEGKRVIYKKKELITKLKRKKLL
jgi:hypothetical protein